MSKLSTLLWVAFSYLRESRDQALEKYTAA